MGIEWGGWASDAPGWSLVLEPRGEAAGDVGGFCALAARTWPGPSLLVCLHFTVEKQLPHLLATSTEFFFFVVCVLGAGCRGQPWSESLSCSRGAWNSPHQPQ